MSSNIKISMFINKDIGKTINAKQNDAKSRYLDIALLNDDGSPYNLTNKRVQFNGLKADHTYIMNDCEIISATDGNIRVELTDQSLTIGDSIIKSDISIFSLDGFEVLTTRTFAIHVQSTVRNDSAVESENQYTAVINLFQDVWEMREVIYNIKEKFGELTDDLVSGDTKAGSSALGALNNIWNYLKKQSTAAIVETVNRIDTNIGTASSAATSNNTMGRLKNLTDRGIIKYKKFGIARMTPTGVTIQIGKTVDVSRTMVILNGVSSRYYSSSEANSLPYLAELTTTTFTIKDATSGTTSTTISRFDFSYQLFEFY